MSEPQDLETHIDDVLRDNGATSEERRQGQLMRAFLEDPRVASRKPSDQLPPGVFLDHAEALGLTAAELITYRTLAAETPGGPL